MGHFSDLKPTIGHFWSVAPANKRGALHRRGLAGVNFAANSIADNCKTMETLKAFVLITVGILSINVKGFSQNNPFKVENDRFVIESLDYSYSRLSLTFKSENEYNWIRTRHWPVIYFLLNGKPMRAYGLSIFSSELPEEYDYLFYKDCIQENGKIVLFSIKSLFSKPHIKDISLDLLPSAFLERPETSFIWSSYIGNRR